MKEFIMIMLIIVSVCMLSFCEPETTKTPEIKNEKPKIIEKTTPSDQPKYREMVPMF